MKDYPVDSNFQKYGEEFFIRKTEKHSCTKCAFSGQKTFCYNLACKKDERKDKNNIYVEGRVTKTMIF